MKKSNPIALLPIGVFLVIYLGLGLLFKYGLKINMGFYNIPIVVAFLIALLVACLQNRELSFDAKLELMGHGIGDKNIVTMILIFMAAGIFVGVVGQQCRKRCLPAAFSCSLAVFCCHSLCRQLLCLAGHGHLGRYHYPYHSYRCAIGSRHRLFPALLRGIGHRRCYVRGQPLLHQRYHHCRLQWPGLPDER